MCAVVCLCRIAVVLMDQAFGDVLISWFDDTLQRLQQLKKRIADNDIPTSDEFERSEAAMLKQFSFLQPSTQWRCLCENGFRVCWKFTKTIQRTDEVAPSFDGKVLFDVLLNDFDRIFRQYMVHQDHVWRRSAVGCITWWMHH